MSRASDSRTASRSLDRFLNRHLDLGEPCCRPSNLAWPHSWRSLCSWRQQNWRRRKDKRDAQGQSYKQPANHPNSHVSNLWERVPRPDGPHQPPPDTQSELQEKLRMSWSSSTPKDEQQQQQLWCYHRAWVACAEVKEASDLLWNKDSIDFKAWLRAAKSWKVDFVWKVISFLNCCFKYFYSCRRPKCNKRP